jgi:hypothetical protein
MHIAIVDETILRDVVRCNVMIVTGIKVIENHKPIAIFV